ncbi:TRADD-N-associated membrane domain-containing protein [Thiothrix lacustris]|uniref:TRADD-N-associated membrane domain-containing protein n=1 Tax=Thiothrix lacustris TaxID=525917 RepID=UPI00048C9497|nr:hypothetical protein [Thiothrix lacustris]
MNTSNSNAINESVISVKQEQILKRLSDADKDDVKEIAISQLDLLSSYYQLSLSQANRSFRWALIASVIGLIFFLLAIGFLIFTNGTAVDQALVCGVGGAVSGFIGGVNFMLYGKTQAQLELFHGKLEATQRFLLANSLCESLGGKLKDYTRARLIGTLAGVTGSDITKDLVSDGVDLGQNPPPVFEPPQDLPPQEGDRRDGDHHNDVAGRPM